MTDTHKTAIVTAPIETVERMHPLVSAAMRSQSALADPATLRELLELQRAWEAGEARKSFTRALAALKRDLPTVIAKDKLVDFPTSKGRTTYRHTTLAAVMDAITEPLTSHGFSLAWVPSTGEKGGVRVTCRLTHQDGHHEECALDAPRDDSGNKSPAQAIASTITLLQRYTALALLGIATADMTEDEPRAEAPPASSSIDAARNLKAAKWLADHGMPVAEVEKKLGRPVSAWTASDVDAMRAYVEERRAARARGEDPDA
jgi:hypothetical protein